MKGKQIAIVGGPFRRLLDSYREQKSSGIYKNKLYQIIKELLMRVGE
jgi:hypothetical protein